MRFTLRVPRAASVSIEQCYQRIVETRKSGNSVELEAWYKTLENLKLKKYEAALKEFEAITVFGWPQEDNFTPDEDDDFLNLTGGL